MHRKNSLFTDEIVENYEEIEYLSMGLWDGKVSQPWRDGSGGNYNLRVTFTYFIYWSVFFCLCITLFSSSHRLRHSRLDRFSRAITQNTTWYYSTVGSVLCGVTITANVQKLKVGNIYLYPNNIAPKIFRIGNRQTDSDSDATCSTGSRNLVLTPYP